MKIVVAEQQDAADDAVIEGAAVRGRGRRTAPPAPADHATTEATLALPATVDSEGEAAEQSLSAEGAAAADRAGPGEHTLGAGEPTAADHAHTDPTLAVPATEGTEAEAAERAMSDDGARAADQAAGERDKPGSTGQGAV
jgi:hypothetical protein